MVADEHVNVGFADFEFNSLFFHFVLPLFFVYVHNIHKLLIAVKRLDKDFSYFLLTSLKTQKICKFGSKKVRIARFRRISGPFPLPPELVHGVLLWAALVPLPAAFPGCR